MSFLRFVQKGKTIEVSKNGEVVAWLRKQTGGWQLHRLEDALSTDELANIRGFVSAK
jgi:hypothetical protein